MSGPHVIALWDAGARCDARVCLACAEERDEATMREPEPEHLSALDELLTRGLCHRETRPGCVLCARLDAARRELDAEREAAVTSLEAMAGDLERVTRERDEARELYAGERNAVQWERDYGAKCVADERAQMQVWADQARADREALGAARRRIAELEAMARPEAAR